MSDKFFDEDNDDIFKEEIVPAKDEGLVNKNRPEESEETKKPAITGIHFTILAALLSAGWIFGPKLFSYLETKEQVVLSTEDKKSKEEESYDFLKPNNHETLDIKTAKIPENSTTNDSYSTNLKDDNDVRVKELEKELMSLRAEGEELSEKVAGLELQLSEKETALNTCLVDTKEKSVSNSKAKPKPRKVASNSARWSVVKKNTAKPKSVRSKPVRHSNNIRKYSLNTVFNGQAWIQNDDRTYVVHVGDVIDGFRIIKIDPNRRQVITSSGVIR
ncbi:hypothetical protein KCM76_22285 [Zooshikella marina]|uniref:hypothetical protein n=1 Tax=Zooshikella ganghwensis TaxID=202772 RepID=UPI001BAE6C2B|nr:hypothetical protein [Zooshikella ganghwensis]MBU2708738.1 hypothetical protein [Zooshikella ganghwensis]